VSYILNSLGVLGEARQQDIHCVEFFRWAMLHTMVQAPCRTALPSRVSVGQPAPTVPRRALALLLPLLLQPKPALAASFREGASEKAAKRAQLLEDARAKARHLLF